MDVINQNYMNDKRMLAKKGDSAQKVNSAEKQTGAEDGVNRIKKTVDDMVGMGKENIE